MSCNSPGTADANVVLASIDAGTKLSDAALAAAAVDLVEEMVDKRLAHALSLVKDALSLAETLNESIGSSSAAEGTFGNESDAVALRNIGKTLGALGDLTGVIAAALAVTGAGTPGAAAFAALSLALSSSSIAAETVGKLLYGQDEGRTPSCDPTTPFLDPGPFDWESIPTCPLVIDLDGNGVELTSLQGSTVHFDLESTGRAINTGWVKASDALLAFDSNGDGAITSGHELFGNNSESGFTVLAFYDGRTGGNYYTDPSGGTISSQLVNGRIDENDPIFAQLKVWRDIDQDGQSDAGELVSLSAAGISYIDLAYLSISPETNAGNAILQRSSVHLTSGAVRAIDDVWFRVDRADVAEAPESEADAFFATPDLRRYGILPSLHEAMSLDPGLASTVSAFVTNSETFNLAELRAAFSEVLLAWAGAQNVPAASRGQWIDARNLTFLERARASHYWQVTLGLQTDHPDQVASPWLQREFDEARDFLLTAFVSQITVANARNYVASGTSFADLRSSRFDVIAGGVSLGSDGSLYLDVNRFASHFTDLDVTDPDAVAAARMQFGLLEAAATALQIDRATYRGELRAALVQHGATVAFNFVDPSHLEGAVDEELPGGGNSQVITYTHSDGPITVDLRPEEYELGDNNILSLLGISPTDVRVDVSSSDFLITFATGTGSITLLNQNTFDAYSRGGVQHLTFSDGTVWSHSVLYQAYLAAAQTSNADILYGSPAADFFEPGVGNDVVYGGTGSDTFMYRLGHGDDVFSDVDLGSDNVLLFGAGLTPADIALTRTQNDVLLSFGALPGSVSLPGQFAGDGAIEIILFADGTTWTIDDLQALYLASAQTTGADIIYGSPNDDMLAGGAGDDVLYGQSGSDTFIYGVGDGADIIFDAAFVLLGDSGSGEINELRLGAGITSANTHISRAGDDALVSFAGGGSVLLKAQFAPDALFIARPGIQRLSFSTLEAWTPDQLKTRYLLEAGTFGNDVIRGFATRDDTIQGGGGNDVLIGDSGINLLDGGDGHDMVSYAPSDTGVIVNLASTGSQDTGFSSDMLISIEAVTGSDYDDLLTGNSGANTFYGGVGSDVVYGGFGADVVYGGFGADALYGSQDNDIVYGNQENDYLHGGQGDDLLYGGQGADTVNGGVGNDTLFGNLGIDVFRFDSNSGSDVIGDFGFGGADQILFGPGTLINYADVVAHSSQVGADVMIAFGSASILIRGVNTTALTSDLFLFG